MDTRSVIIDKDASEITKDDLLNFEFNSAGMFSPFLRAGMVFAIGRSSEAGSTFKTQCYRISNLEKLIVFESEGNDFKDFGMGVVLYDTGDTIFTKGLFVGWKFLAAFGELVTTNFTNDEAWIAATFLNNTSKYWLPQRVLEEARRIEDEKDAKEDL